MPENSQEYLLCSDQSQSSGRKSKLQNHKLKLPVLITRAVCSLVSSRLIGFFFATQ